MKKTAILLALAALLLAGCGTSGSNDDSCTSLVEDLLSRMTLEEKIGQTVLYTSDWSVTGPSIRDGYIDDIRAGRCGNIFNAYTAAYTRKLQEVAVNETRLGIPILFGYDVIHGFRTIFPINLGLSASWDIEAIEESARIAGREAAAAGLHWTYSPMCDICVEPRWGRISEGAGEDPYLGSLIAAAMTRGYQGDDLGDENTILACVKHYAAYGAPQAGRDYNTVDMSDRWLREFYLPPYKAAVDAGALSVMASFNELDGVPATANKYLMTDILRGEWGFDGFVVTDYTGITEMICHGNVTDAKDAARAAINAGIDMDMQSAAFSDNLAALIHEGKVSEKTLDEAVRRILTVKAKLGLFEDPYRYCSEERERELTMTPENLAFARRIASESMVLLQNDGVLPLRKGQKIAVIGALAESADDLLGSWRGAGEADKVETIVDAMRDYNGASNIIYARGCDEISDDKSGFQAALSAVSRAEKVVMVIGEDCQWTGEAASRSSINIPGVQSELLERIAATGKPVAVVLLNGRPLDLSAESQMAGAILEAWYPGTMGGQAVTDVLFGEFNPCGKLSVTFPRALGQVPIYHYAKNTGRPYVHPDAKYESRYLDVVNEPLFAFGHGLAYTSFEYSDIELGGSGFSGNGSLSASVTVTNTGEREGTEVVQMYIRDLVGSVTRPVKQLKGFQRVTLAPGQSERVSFTIDASTLSFYRQDMTFGPEAGDFKLFIGGASDNVKEASFNYSL
ncbi:MAG: glycoside hydrolase family 3 C-terminal domain-containing protein [Bacteroidales bacterium]|nr:glycoside hydrolase family 3 C-terminal domain-containing protein [Bacteroidales bacterium]